MIPLTAVTDRDLLVPVSQAGCENMGTAVVDLMLQETQQQLQTLQEQHAALQHKMQDVQQHNEITSKQVSSGAVHLWHI